MSLKERLKAKAKEEKQRQESKGGNYDEFFKPQVGVNKIRILPHWKKPTEELFFVERAVHYIPQKTDDGKEYRKVVACLKEFGKDCPVCEVVEKLRKKDPKSKEATGLRAQRKALYNIIDYIGKGDEDNPEPCVVPYMVPETIHAKILSWCEDAGEFYSYKGEDGGRNWKLEKKVDPKKGPIFGVSYEVFPDMKESNVNKSLLKLIKNGIKNLDKIYASEEDELMISALKAHGLGKYLSETTEMFEEDDDDDELDIPFGEDEAPKKKAKAKKASPKKKKKLEVVEDDDDDEDDVEVDDDDDDLDAELAALGLED
jgi:hypothetical protein